MEEKPRRGLTPGMIVGAALLLIGLLLVGDYFDLVEVENLLHLWPVLLIALGISHLAGGAVRGFSLWGLALVLGGLLILLMNLEVLDVSWELVGALLVAGIGLSVLLRAIRYAGGGPRESGPRMREWAIFGGGERRVTSPELRGGEVSAVFGGVDLDLREAGAESGEIALEVFVLFGGIDIKVPEGCQVVTQVLPIFGGVSDKTRSRKPSAAPGLRRLHVQGSTFFGGIEISD